MERCSWSQCATVVNCILSVKTGRNHDMNSYTQGRLNYSTVRTWSPLMPLDLTWQRKHSSCLFDMVIVKSKSSIFLSITSIKLTVYFTSVPGHLKQKLNHSEHYFLPSAVTFVYQWPGQCCPPVVLCKLNNSRGCQLLDLFSQLASFFHTPVLLSLFFFFLSLS